MHKWQIEALRPGLFFELDKRVWYLLVLDVPQLQPIKLIKLIYHLHLLDLVVHLIALTKSQGLTAAKGEVVVEDKVVATDDTVLFEQLAVVVGVSGHTRLQ